jgi:hypothetical protein
MTEGAHTYPLTVKAGSHDITLRFMTADDKAGILRKKVPSTTGSRN